MAAGTASPGLLPMHEHFRFMVNVVITVQNISCSITRDLLQNRNTYLVHHSSGRVRDAACFARYNMNGSDPGANYLTFGTIYCAYGPRGELTLWQKHNEARDRTSYIVMVLRLWPPVTRSSEGFGSEVSLISNNITPWLLSSSELYLHLSAKLVPIFEEMVSRGQRSGSPTALISIF
jgi:hypothetical protein